MDGFGHKGWVAQGRFSDLVVGRLQGARETGGYEPVAFPSLAAVRRERDEQGIGMQVKWAALLSPVVREVARCGRISRERMELLKLVRAERRTLAGLLGTHLLAAALPTVNAMAIGWLTARLSSVVSRGADASTMTVPLAVLVLLMLAEELAVAFRDVLQLVVAGRLDGRARRRVRALVMEPRFISHMEDPEYLDDVSRASNIGAGTFRSPGKAAVGQILLTFRVFSACAATILLSLYFPVLALGLLAASLLMRSIIRRQWMYLASVMSAGERGARRVRYWTDVAGGREAAKEVRLFGLVAWAVRRRTREALESAADLWQARAEVLGKQWWTIGIALGSAASALFFPALAFRRDEISAGELMTCLTAAWVIFQVSFMGMEAFDIEYGFDAVQALQRLENRGRRDGLAFSGGMPEKGRTAPAEVRLEKVTFRYPGSDQAVLDELDLHISSGEVLAIVGNSGVGKTTLIKLLAGLYETDEGRITVDGTDLSEIDAEAWRGRLAVVFQDFNRYPLSAVLNVALGAPEAMHDTAGAVRAMTRISGGTLPGSLPFGPDTVLSGEQPDGVDLSGGQWQQIAVARAMFAAQHGRDLIILDEPTAHLDVETEAAFYQRVVTEVRGRSVVLISHRMSTIRHADRIILLSDGKVAESGSHQELMAADGEYARLFKLQAARFRGHESSEAPARSS